MSASDTTAVAAAEPELRFGARVLVLDPHDRMLLIHARDPDEPASEWWELPGGGIDPGETPQAAASRELAE
jgi:8-oxo-dGTP pyrophosphatase MutT (NUDIX family)